MSQPLSGRDIRNNTDVINVDSMLSTKKGGLPRSRPFHCTPVWLKPAIAPNVSNSGTQFFRGHSYYGVRGEILGSP